MRQTPCIGICSTTYGDLICRGCKRFAHEIVGWNGFSGGQRTVVWTRLNQLLCESVRAYLTVVDEERLRAIAPDRVPDAAGLPAEVVAFRTMCACPLPLNALGLAAKGDAATTRETARRIDREFYTRSRAYYEASFKTLT